MLSPSPWSMIIKRFEPRSAAGINSLCSIFGWRINYGLNCFESFGRWFQVLNRFVRWRTSIKPPVENGNLVGRELRLSVRRHVVVIIQWQCEPLTQQTLGCTVGIDGRTGIASLGEMF